MKNPIVIDPPGFDQNASWKECSDYVEKCGGLVHEDGEPNWRAAFGADPGCCSCPNCGEMYWQWGRVQSCVVCGFEYPVDWWPAYSEGCNHGLRLSGQMLCPEPMLGYFKERREKRRGHPYYEFGFSHPVVNAWWHSRHIDWKYVLTHEGSDMYTPSERVTTQLSTTFRWHRPQGNQPERYERIREEGGKLAHLIATNTPESREQSVALTKLQEVVMFANAAIAINEEWDGNKMTKPLEIEVEGRHR